MGFPEPRVWPVDLRGSKISPQAEVTFTTSGRKAAVYVGEVRSVEEDEAYVHITNSSNPDEVSGVRAVKLERLIVLKEGVQW